MTVAEMFAKLGFSEEQIKGLDAKLVEGYQSVLTEAENARAAAMAKAQEAADIERRYNHMYATEIVPALNKWGSEAAVKDAEIEFYRKQNEGARSAGFLPKDAPTFTADKAATEGTERPRSSDGRYVAGGNPVVGSPGAVDRGEFLHAMSEMSWAENKYKNLYDTNSMPEDYDFFKDLGQASSRAMKFRDYFAEKYKFADKERERNERKQKEHDESIRKDERVKLEKEWAERGGGNPALRPASESKFAGIRKGMQSGQWKDPVKLSPEQRRLQNSQMIASDQAEMQSQGTA